MMTAGWQERINRVPQGGSYGVCGRSFFVPEAKCQALVLACQALQDESAFQMLGKKVACRVFGWLVSQLEEVSR